MTSEDAVHVVSPRSMCRLMLLLAVSGAAVAQDLLTVSGVVTLGMNGRAIYARIGRRL
jgi:hypothetical protein